MSKLGEAWITPQIKRGLRQERHRMKETQLKNEEQNRVGGDHEIRILTKLHRGQPGDPGQYSPVELSPGSLPPVFTLHQQHQQEPSAGA